MLSTVLLYAVNRTVVFCQRTRSWFPQVCIDNILVDESGELHLIDFEGTRVLLYVTCVPHVELAAWRATPQRCSSERLRCIDRNVDYACAKPTRAQE